MPVYGHQRKACTIKSHLVYIGRVIRSWRRRRTGIARARLCGWH